MPGDVFIKQPGFSGRGCEAARGRCNEKRPPSGRANSPVARRSSTPHGRANAPAVGGRASTPGGRASPSSRPRVGEEAAADVANCVLGSTATVVAGDGG